MQGVSGRSNRRPAGEEGENARNHISRAPAVRAGPRQHLEQVTLGATPARGLQGCVS